MAVTQGLWNIGGFNLLDLGISEALGLDRIGVPNNANQYQQGQNFPLTQQAQKTVSSGQVLGSQASTLANSLPYNQAASIGAVAGPVNPSSGYSQPSGSQPSQLDQLRAIAPKDLNPWQRNQLNTLEQQADPYAQVRNDISSGWDNYLNSLQGTSGFLNDQQNSQRGIADSQLQQGIDTANTNKAKSLRDIANTTRNAFQAGNNYLGALGAGDSSAANQYSFAINQQANKQIGNLNEFVSTQIKDLQYQHDQQIQQIASWFSQQQQALKQQIATGQLSKSQDLANLSKSLLDQAIQATNQIKSNTQNQYNALVEWATANSQNVNQLGQNISQIGQYFDPGQVSMIGRTASPVRHGGAPATQDTDILGRPIR